MVVILLPEMQERWQWLAPGSLIVKKNSHGFKTVVQKTESVPDDLERQVGTLWHAAPEGCEGYKGKKQGSN